jgi:succinylglutamic semialdehyde dehydrogenase
MVSSIKHLIGGKFKEAVGVSLSSFSPSTGRVIGRGSEASDEQVQLAVTHAKQAFLTWREYSVSDRYQILQRYQACLESEQESLAQLISEEMGKPIWESRLEVVAMIKKVEISYQAYQERCPTREVSLLGVGGGQSVVRHVPHGVFVVMGPFNFPGHLPNGHIIPALLAGNTVVFKSSDYTPLVGQKLGELFIEAGIPSGVVNVVHGGRNVGKLLIEHPDISGVLFTGSSTTGRYLSSYFGKSPDKLLALEMGGNNALIVESYDSIEAVAWIIISSAFLTSGQRCTAARRLIMVDTDQNRALLDRVVDWTRQLKIGSGLDESVFMGPLISDRICDDLGHLQSKLMSDGGNSVLSSHRLDRPGFFVTPGIMDVSRIEQLLDQEFFGPFLQVIWVSSMDEAIDRANQTQFGLSAAVITPKKQCYDHVRSQLRVGILNWNMPTNGASSMAPFGGVGCSGNFRPSAYYAADYCAYPVASMESDQCQLPQSLPPGAMS